MAVSGTLRTFLKTSNVKYTTATHPVAYTAQELAAAQHVSGRQVAKCVLLITDRGPVLSVLPATSLIDLAKLKRLLRARTLIIGKESDIRAAFPDVEVGAMSPFGQLYQVPVVVDRALVAAERIVFNAGSHAQTITMRCADVLRLVHPTVGEFGRSLSRPSAPAPKKPRSRRPAARKKSAATRRRPSTRTR